MNSIDESEALLLRKQARGHARPQSEDDEGNKIARRQRPPASLVEPSGGIMVEPCEEEDGSWNMDEAEENRQRKILHNPATPILTCKRS